MGSATPPSSCSATPRRCGGGEVADLGVDDLEPQPGGLFIHIRASKTGREGHGQMVGIVAWQRQFDDDEIAEIAEVALRDVEDVQNYFRGRATEGKRPRWQARPRRRR